jgi:hypothetical protein
MPGVGGTALKAAVIGGLAALTVSATVAASPIIATPITSVSDDKPAERMVNYAPPDRSMKKKRVVDQSRSAFGGASIAVLAPDETGETTLAQPTLYWFASAPVFAKVELAIIEEATQKTVFETRMDGPTEPGIVAVPLGKLRVSLRSEREYRWSVSVARHANQPSPDLFASGSIRRTEISAELAGRLNRTSPAEMPYFLAENGLWYDALAVLSVQIARNPGDRRLRNLRAGLLDQVGLYEVAGYDRK